MVILPSGDRQPQIRKAHTDFVHHSSMSWVFARIFETNRAGNFLKAVLHINLPLGTTGLPDTILLSR